MSVEDLRHKLLSDLWELNLPLDEVDVFFRPYSKTYYGRYFPARDEAQTRPKIYIYPLETRCGKLLPYETILSTAVHELCHHIQYAGGHVRVKGVMHDSHFWKLYKHYMKRAAKRNLVSAEVECCVQ